MLHRRTSSGIGSRKAVAATLFVMLVLALGASPLAGIEIEPEAPRWGQELVIRVTPESSKGMLYPGDHVFVGLMPIHQGINRIVTEKAAWDGQAFYCRLTLPSDCEKAQVFVNTTEGCTKYRTSFLPRTETGEILPGADALSWPRKGEDVALWKQRIESALAANPHSWWLYPEVWQKKLRGLGDSTVEEILSQLRSLEVQEKTPSLLRTLAYGYWNVGQPDKAFKRLAALCTRFPDSPYSVKAFNEADYQIFSKNLDELRPRLETLKARVVNESPTNPQLQQEVNAVGWVVHTQGVRLGAVRNLFESWVEGDPANAYPYFLLANALLKEEASYEEAERLINKSFKLFHQPRPLDPREYLMGMAFRTRSQLRLKRGDVAGALGDIKMAQEYALVHWTEDLETEAEIWKGIGYLNKAEEILLGAYRKGSLTAEELFRKTFASRTGTDDGFQEYFMGQLTGEASNPDFS